MSGRIFFIVWISLMISVYAYAGTEDDDLQAEYMSDINRPADAKVQNVYSAWGQNMANLIEHGARDGIIIDGDGRTDGKIQQDGVGNIYIDNNTNTGAVINNTKMNNSSVIIMKDKHSRMR